MVSLRTLWGGIPWNLFLLTVGCGLFSFGIKAVAIPQAFISGGVFGTAILCNYLTGMGTASLWNLLLNVPIFAIGWFLVGRRFVLYSLYGLLVLSLGTEYITLTIPFSEPLLAAIAGGCLCGLGLGIVLHSQGCDGGLTIVSIALYQRYGVSIGQFNLCYNITLFVCAFSFYNPDHALYSLVMIFVYSRVMDYVSTIFNQRKLVLIISTRHDSIAKNVIASLHRGVTVIPGYGGYTGASRPVLMTVVQNFQIKMLEEIIMKHDPHAFVIIENTLNVLGRGFSTRRTY